MGLRGRVRKGWTKRRPSAGVYLGGYPTAAKKPSWTLKPTAKATSTASAPAASMDEARKCISPGTPDDVSGPMSVAPNGTTPSTAPVYKRRQARGLDERRDPNSDAWDSRRLPVHYRCSAVPRWWRRCKFSQFFPPGASMHTPVVEKLGQAHARSRDSEAAGGLAFKCAGCSATPVKRRDQRSLWVKSGDVQRSKRAAAMETLAALRTHPA